MYDSFNKLLKNKYAVCLILAVVAAVPYLSSLKGEFVFDDIPLLQADPFYQADHSFLDCWKRDYWMEPMAQGLYRPLTTFSYWLNFKICGLYSPAFRTVNLLLNIFAVIIVFFLALNLKTGRKAAFLCAAVFALHPLHTEAVIPAFGRGEVLCGLFIFLGLLFHIKSVKKPFMSVLTAICFILACWSKEHGVTLLPLCVLYDIYSGRLKMEKVSFLSNMKFYGFYIAAVAVVVTTRYAAMGTVLPAMTRFDSFFDNQLALCSYPVRVLSAINIQGYALLLFIWPKTLSHDYSFAQMLPLKSAIDPIGLLGAAVVISLPFMLAWIFPRSRKQIIFLSIAYLICILPAANIITPTGTIFAERLYYIPSLWLCMLLACIVVRYSYGIDKGLVPILVLSIILVLAALGLRTFVRSFDWQNQLSISLAGVETSPKSAKTWNNLAVQYAHEEKLDDAIKFCGEAIKIYPSFKMAYINRGFYFIKKGDLRSAEKDLHKVIELGTENTEVYNKLGAILANLGREEEAMKYWKISLKLDSSQTMMKRAVEDLQKDIDGKNPKLELRNSKQ